jgi:threonine synthase
VALSIGDASGAAITLDALRASGGGAVETTDEEILATVGKLARIGVAAEPSAAAAVAAALKLQQEDAFGPDEDVVCLVTGAAAKWPDTISLSFEPKILEQNDRRMLMAWIEAMDESGFEGRLSDADSQAVA